jgi:hypothetical protein
MLAGFYPQANVNPQAKACGIATTFSINADALLDKWPDDETDIVDIQVHTEKNSVMNGNIFLILGGIMIVICLQMK